MSPEQLELIDEFNQGEWLDTVDCLPCFKRANASPCADPYSRAYFFCSARKGHPAAAPLCAQAKSDFQACYQENRMYYEIECTRSRLFLQWELIFMQSYLGFIPF